MLNPFKNEQHLVWTVLVHYFIFFSIVIYLYCWLVKGSLFKQTLYWDKKQITRAVGYAFVCFSGAPTLQLFVFKLLTLVVTSKLMHLSFTNTLILANSVIFIFYINQVLALYLLRNQYVPIKTNVFNRLKFNYITGTSSLNLLLLTPWVLQTFC